MRKRLHRRHQSVGNAKYSMEENTAERRRSSNLWWAQDEVFKHNARRPNSWGPVGMEQFATDCSLMYQNVSYVCDLRLLHGQCI